jgi:hypothetical protein
MDEAQEDYVEFLEAREDATKALQTAKKPLNLISFAVHSRVELPRVWATADWHRRRDMSRTLVERVEIGLEGIKIVLRVTPEARGTLVRMPFRRSSREATEINRDMIETRWQGSVLTN